MFIFRCLAVVTALAVLVDIASGVELACMLPFHYGDIHCDKSVSTRYYYDVFSDSCYPFPYRGCGGNGNNFQSEAACLLSCQRS
ncbi:PI-actitoxin-Afv2a-like [Pomacea canaliculata]|uniref:PI-actitoxin-Afv2a-like n=1 Tax=Pomacea canaliculata TaxID=400727 RepID=UPI000D73DE48|nr:PI-actitoxin-Afv2a-like [Pomacea canaliculata]